ncbi:hypothetical protein PoB_005291800 [Plakobranchus ocellatus]|uniref:Uncharacterized protein n=1 Tax=Plakobranchus ocellatus TaxID=259542 RepID=A0AAV4C5Z6_9GAST|nr:hypothetical protein PoB_005291800 [Plakobranchus ocellatus]
MTAVSKVLFLQQKVLTLMRRPIMLDTGTSDRRTPTVLQPVSRRKHKFVGHTASGNIVTLRSFSGSYGREINISNSQSTNPLRLVAWIVYDSSVSVVKYECSVQAVK